MGVEGSWGGRGWCSPHSLGFWGPQALPQTFQVRNFPLSSYLGNHLLPPCLAATTGAGRAEALICDL